MYKIEGLRMEGTCDMTCVHMSVKYGIASVVPDNRRLERQENVWYDMYVCIRMYVIFACVIQRDEALQREKITC